MYEKAMELHFSTKSCAPCNLGELRISQDIFFPDVRLGWKNHFCVCGTVLGAGIIVVP